MPMANEAVDVVRRSHLLQRPPIVLTNSDRDSLLALLRTSVTDMEPSVACFLREELERADIVSGEISPIAVVSIGSTVKFIDHAAMSTRQVTLVLPDEANDVDLIPVTGALGSALIGLGPGQTISWHEGQTERQATVVETNKSAGWHQPLQRALSKKRR
jgi:regulator of nucleoside diphosphate kinase